MNRLTPLVLLLFVGCLDTGRPSRPVVNKTPTVVVVSTDLAGALAQNFASERATLVAGITAIAIKVEADPPLSGPDQQKAWADLETVREKFAANNAELIANAFKKTTKASETAAVWRQIAKAYSK